MENFGEKIWNMEDGSYKLCLKHLSMRPRNTTVSSICLVSDKFYLENYTKDNNL